MPVTRGRMQAQYLLPHGPTPEDEESDHEQEESIWGWEEECISHPASAPSAGMDVDTPPGSQQGTPAKPRLPPPTPLRDIEICTPIQLSKRPRLQTPGSTIPWRGVKHRGPNKDADVLLTHHMQQAQYMWLQQERIMDLTCEAKTSYQQKTALYWHASRQARQTIYLIRKQPRAQWDPTLWEVPLQPLPKRQKAHWDPNEWEIPLT